MGRNRERVGLALLLAVVLSSVVACAVPADRAPGKVIDDARLLCGPALMTASGGGNAVDDATVTAEVRAALRADQRVDAAAIAVATAKGEVVLTGAVDSAAQSKRAESIARSIIGVVEVKNLLTIK